MGFVFNDDEPCLSDEWHDDFNEVLETIDVKDAIREEDMQVDNRNVIYYEEE